MPDEFDREFSEILEPAEVGAAMEGSDEESQEEEAAELEASEEVPSEEDDGEEYAGEDEEEEDDEVTQLRAELAAMREALATATGKKAVAEPQAPVEPEIDEVNFLEGIDMEDLQEDPKAFNAILNNVLRKGVSLGRESVLKDLPNIVTYNVRQQSALKEAVDKFYADNKDLVPFKRAVGAITEEILSNDPSLSLEDLFAKSAVEARARLALVKKADESSNGSGKKERKPGLPGRQRGGRKPSTEPKLTPQEEEVLDLIKGV